MTKNYNFPYYGAGQATYFEWASVQIIFKEKPIEKQKKLIEKNVPFPISDCNWKENTLAASSDAIVHVDIADIYITKDGLDPKNKDDWRDDWFFAASSQVDAFNNDIERWLKEIHEISPILLVFRNEDDESGGTEFSDWHKWSLNQIELVLPYFDDVINSFDYGSIKSFIILEILYMNMAEDISKFDDKYVKFLYPGRIEFEAFEKGDVRPLKNISNTNYAEKTIKNIIGRIKAEHQENIIKYVNVFLSFEQLIQKKTFEKLNEILFTYLSDIDSKTFKKIAENIKNVNFIDSFACKIHPLMSAQKYQESIDFCEKLMLIPIEPEIRTGFYTNMLWVFQKDNTGFPINKNRNRLALEKSLPKGAEYPAIFFNACCIYTEMEEYDNAYKMVEKSIEYNYDKDFMINEIKTENMFKGFREKTDVLELLENFKLKSKENPTPRFVGESYAYGQFDIHNIYNRGFAVSFSNILLFDGSVSVNKNFNDTYIIQLEEKGEVENGTLVIVNGNLTVKSIGIYENVSLLVMGKIDCSDILLEDVIEKGKTDFSFIVQKLKKKHNE